MRPTFYVLASAFAARDADTPDWPYQICVSFDPTPTPVDLSEGRGHASGGITLSARDALAPQWREHFAKAGGLWLIPHLEKMARGEPVSTTLIWAEHQALHGRQPTACG